MSTVQWVINEMEVWAPPSFVEEYDNVGLLVGDAAQPIAKILIALDATMDVIDEAINGGYDCIITHHPIIRDPMKRIISEDATGRKIISLIRHSISLYAAHTNLDKAIGGVSDCLAEKIGLLQTTPMTREPNSKIGFGRVGELSHEITLGEFAEHMKNALGLQSVRICGSVFAKVKKVALCGGSGMSFWQSAKDSGCDVYITGDVKYSDALAALESDICIVDITHYSSENVVVKAIVERLRAKAEQDGITLEICESKVDGQTFHTI